MSNLYPILSSSPIWPAVGDAFSWITVDNDIPRQLYAQAVYTVNHGNNYDTVNNSDMLSANGQILSTNSIRKALYCRNCSTDTLFIKFGLSASPTSWNVVLKGDPEGFGESFFDEQVYHGDVSVYSENPLFMMWEGF